MSDEQSNAIELAKVSQIVANIDKNVEQGFSRVEKRFDNVEIQINELDEKFEGKIQFLDKKYDGRSTMTRKELNEIDKRVSMVEEGKLDKDEFENVRGTVKTIKWVAAIFFIAVIGFVAYAAVQGFANYVNSYGL